MAKIGGITIKIGGDTTELNRALKQTDTEIKNTQRSLADVEKKLKLDPSNITLIEQKAKLLGNTVKQTGDKLKALQEAEAKLKESGIDENSTQFLALEREIKATEEALKDAEKAAASFNANLEKVKGSAEKVATVAGNISEKTKALSAVAGAAVTGLVTMGVKAAATADDLNTLAAQSGLTTEEIQKFQYAADVVDVGTDTIVSALTKMKRNMDSNAAAETWSRLGISVRDASGQLRDSSDVFYEVLDRLSKVGNETERDVLAMDLFGKSADQLAGIIDDGGEALRKLGDEAENLGLIMDQETIDATNRFNDEIDKLKATFTADIFKAGANALEALEPVITKIVNAVTGLINWFANLDSGTLKIILTIGTFVALISPVAGIIAGISSAVNVLIGAVSALGVALNVSVPEIALVAAAVVGLTLAIGKAAEFIMNNWDSIKQGFRNGIEAIKGWFQSGIDTIKGAWDKFAGFFENLWETLKQRAIDNINTMIGWINSGIEAINRLIEGFNSLKLVQGLGINVGTIGTIQEVGSKMTNGSPEMMGAQARYYQNSSVTNNTYNQLAANPIQVNMNLDGMTVARQLIDPMDYQRNLRGASTVR